MAILAKDIETTDGYVRDLILKGVKIRIEEILKEEIEITVNKVKERIKSEVDKISLSVLSYFTIEDFGHTIRIEVKKDI